MSQFILNIKDESKMDVLLNFLKSLNYISVEKVDSDIVLTDEQKQVLDQRRSNSSVNGFIDWETAKKQLKFKKK